MDRSYTVFLLVQLTDYHKDFLSNNRTGLFLHCVPIGPIKELIIQTFFPIEVLYFSNTVLPLVFLSDNRIGYSLLYVHIGPIMGWIILSFYPIIGLDYLHSVPIGPIIGQISSSFYPIIWQDFLTLCSYWLIMGWIILSIQ